MELKARECPHCHQKVSINVCSEYFLHGTAYEVHCNHCNTGLMLIKEPIPFKWCPLAGFLCVVIPAEYFLYIKNLGLIESLSYAAIFGMFGLLVCMILTLNRIYFKIA